MLCAEPRSLDRVPTSKKRVMLNVSDDLYQQLEKVSKVERRSMASTCLLLIEAALAIPKFREILRTSPKADDQIVKEMGLDKLDASRLKELKALLGTLEQLKGGDEQ